MKGFPDKNFPKKIYQFCLHSVRLLMLLFTGMLLVCGFLLTCFSTNMETQEVLTKWDNPFLSFLGTILIGLIFLFFAAYTSGKNIAFSTHFATHHSRQRLLRLFVLCWCVLWGILQILFSKTVPAADAYSVYDIAQSLAAGDTTVIHPTDSYLSYYPQQIGLAAFWEVLMRIWNLTPIDQHAYHFMKIIYILLGCVIILFQEKTVHILWQDERTDCLYLLLAGANCPFLMYTSFLYGEIPSFAAISIGFYLLFRLLTDKTTPRNAWCLAAGSLIFLTLSVMLRKNSLIYIIAVVLVLLCTACIQQTKRTILLLLACAYLICALTILPGVQKLYEYRSGNTISSGVPATSYFAMGMQESSRANGWYNGFNFNTYQDTGMNRAATTAISREAIRERLSYFKEHPGYTVRFYAGKFLSQWMDGTYACRQATLATFGGRSPFFTSLYEGTYSKYLIAYCNIYQNILYLGAFWFCLTSLGRKRAAHSIASSYGITSSHDIKLCHEIKSHPGHDSIASNPADEPNSLPSSAPTSSELFVFLGLIGVFGGFLFHMIWEGNSRYIFLYGLTLLPYTARGLQLLAATFSNTLHRRKSS